MERFKTLVWFLAIALIFPWHGVGAAEPRDDDEYLRDIKPILLKHCFKCHSSARDEGNLRLDSHPRLLQGGDRGPAVIAGKSHESLLIAAVRGRDDLKMPPQGERLTNEEIAKLAAWIDRGAKGPADGNEGKSYHWSFQQPQRPEIPTAGAAGWSLNPTDAFIAAEHSRRGLVPVLEAPKHVLLRRLYVDLVGLPPTAEQLAEFLADDSPDAYERTVDKLLADPAYGERWGRHWMDVWRYSDWDGYRAEIRESQPHIWRWRDWIVESLNEDKAYSQMVQEMLAGDELAPTDPKVLRATGYLVRNWYKFNRHQWLNSTIEHTGKAFLGMTFNCARCHDHMYDPLSQQDYYQLRAIFEAHEIRTDRVPGETDTTKDGLVRVYDAHPNTETFLFLRGNEKTPNKDQPLTAAIPKLFQTELKIAPVSIPSAGYYQGGLPFVVRDLQTAAEGTRDKAFTNWQAATKQLAEAVDKLLAGSSSDEALKTAVESADRQLQLAIAQLSAEEAGLVALRARVAADELAYRDPQPANFRELAQQAVQAERRFKYEQTLAKILETEIAFLNARKEVKPGDAKLEKALQTAETAFHNALKAHEDAVRATEGEPDEKYSKLTTVYPSTSTGRRTAFARWVVAEDNPLAARVAVNHMWLRHFGSPLVPTMFDFGQNGKPPTNRALLDWLATELVAEGWSMKSLHRELVNSRTYRLHSTAGSAGSPNTTSDPDNLYYWRGNPRRLEAEVVRDALLHAAQNLDFRRGGADLDPELGTKLPRRSIYFRNTKEKRMTFLTLFDSPSVVECYRRDESIVPQQALALANSDLALAQSRSLAKQLFARQKEMSNSEAAAQAIAVAFAVILNRPPTAEETQTCQDFLEQQTAQFSELRHLQAFPGGTVAGVAPATEPLARAYENLVHVLLNHNDFVTLR